MRVKPIKQSEEEDEENAELWHLVVDGNGVPRCSCGGELIKMDSNTYRCIGGYPVYRFNNGELRKDKWGNIYMRNNIPHEDNRTDEEKQNGSE